MKLVIKFYPPGKRKLRPPEREKLDVSPSMEKPALTSQSLKIRARSPFMIRKLSWGGSPSSFSREIPELKETSRGSLRRLNPAEAFSIIL